MAEMKSPSSIDRWEKWVKLAVKTSSLRWGEWTVATCCVRDVPKIQEPWKDERRGLENSALQTERSSISVIISVQVDVKAKGIVKNRRSLYDEKIKNSSALYRFSNRDPVQLIIMASKFLKQNLTEFYWQNQQKVWTTSSVFQSWMDQLDKN